MVNRAEYFDNLETKDQIDIYIADERVIRASQKVTIRIQLLSSSNTLENERRKCLVLRKAYLAEDIDVSLSSVGELDKRNITWSYMRSVLNMANGTLEGFSDADIPPTADCYVFIEIKQVISKYAGNLVSKLLSTLKLIRIYET